MRIRSLELKPFISKGGERIVNLIRKTWRFSTNKVSDYSVYVVKKGEDMRPDIISNSVYGSTDYVDAVLKYNNISAWWSIKEGDILLLPTPDYLDTGYFKPSENIKSKDKKTNLIEKFTDPSKKSTKDQNRLEFLKKKAESKKRGAKNIVPTTFVNSPEENVTKRNGRINLS